MNKTWPTELGSGESTSVDFFIAILNFMNNQFNLIATAASGVEALVKDELKKLDFENIQSENGFVRFTGEQSDILKANIWSRVADRIKINVAEFEAYSFEDLFSQVKQINWSSLIGKDDQFIVNARAKDSQLMALSSIQSITKKAIVDNLMSSYSTNELPETGNLYPIEVIINKDHVMITLDTSGEGLFKRGYRVDKGGAPLKENFAAALVKLTNWFTDNPFVDPTTGSGTIAIEAALIGKNIAPNLNRKFLIQDWFWYDRKIDDQVRDQAESLAKYDEPLDIQGFDIDQSMIDIAKENAKNAGLSNDLTFKQLAVKDWKTDQKNGIIVANPPYGVRLGELEEARDLYRQMGDIYNQMPTWSEYILTADEDFEIYYGAKATKKRKLYNGAIKTDYYQYWGKKER